MKLSPTIPHAPPPPPFVMLLQAVSACTLPRAILSRQLQTALLQILGFSPAVQPN